MAYRSSAGHSRGPRRRAQLRVEQLESRNLFDAGLVHVVVGANLTDPTGPADGVDHIKQGSTLGADSVTYYIHSHGGNAKITQAQRDRIHAAVTAINSGNTGVTLVEVFNNNQADIHVHNNSSSGCGTAAQGVVGCAAAYYYIAPLGQLADGHDVYRFAGIEAGTLYQAKVTMLTGWNFYSGADPNAVGSNQIDYQAVVEQELAHAVGLDHDVNLYGSLNGDGHSVMYPYVFFGHAHRDFSAHDYASLEHLYKGGPQTALIAPGDGAVTTDHHHGHDGAISAEHDHDLIRALVNLPRGSMVAQTAEPATPLPSVTSPVQPRATLIAETGLPTGTHFIGGRDQGVRLEQTDPAQAKPVVADLQGPPAPATQRTAPASGVAESSPETWSRACTAFFSQQGSQVATIENLASKYAPPPDLQALAKPGSAAAVLALIFGSYLSAPQAEPQGESAEKRRNWGIRR